MEKQLEIKNGWFFKNVKHDAYICIRAASKQEEDKLTIDLIESIHSSYDKIVFTTFGVSHSVDQYLKSSEKTSKKYSTWKDWFSSTPTLKLSKNLDNRDDNSISDSRLLNSIPLDSKSLDSKQERILLLMEGSFVPESQFMNQRKECDECSLLFFTTIASDWNTANTLWKITVDYLIIDKRIGYLSAKFLHDYFFSASSKTIYSFRRLYEMLKCNISHALLSVKEDKYFLYRSCSLWASRILLEKEYWTSQFKTCLYIKCLTTTTNETEWIRKRSKKWKKKNDKDINNTCLKDHLYLFWSLRFYFPKDITNIILSNDLWCKVPFNEENTIVFQPFDFRN